MLMYLHNPGVEEYLDLSSAITIDNAIWGGTHVGIRCVYNQTPLEDTLKLE